MALCRLLNRIGVTNVRLSKFVQHRGIFCGKYAILNTSTVSCRSLPPLASKAHGKVSGKNKKIYFTEGSDVYPAKSVTIYIIARAQDWQFLFLLCFVLAPICFQLFQTRHVTRQGQPTPSGLNSK